MEPITKIVADILGGKGIAGALDIAREIAKALEPHHISINIGADIQTSARVIDATESNTSQSQGEN